MDSRIRMVRLLADETDYYRGVAMNELPKSILTKRQVQKHVKHVMEDGKQHTLFIDIRYDDSCGNGHNSFAITGSFYRGKYDIDPKSERNLITCGAIHDTIEQHAPEYAPFIKWHLTSSDGPMYYVENTVYHASNRDYNGRLKGEPYAFERKLMFNDVPFLYTPSKELLAFIDEVGLNANWTDFELIELEHKENAKGGYQFKPRLSFALMPVTKWHKAPFDNWDEARNFVHAMTHCKVEIVKRATQYGEGKERDFDAARSCAIWPEATDEQLSLPKEELTKLLLERLPALMQDFKHDMEKLGFTY